MLKCILIDDEPLALRQLSNYASHCPELEVVAMFRTAVAARDYLVECGDGGVDLIFCDINMPEMSGVEFVREMQQEGRDGVLPMVIFTTAYAEYAVEGFRLDAVDYLLKPFPQEDFIRSVQRANSLYELRRGYLSQGELQGTRGVDVDDEAELTEAEYLSVRADHKVTMVRLRDIIYIESEGEYVRIHIDGERPITTFCRMKSMETQLPEQQFVRVHRSYIVNLSRVQSYERTRLFISKCEYLPIGLNYRAAFQQRMLQRDEVLSF